MRIILLQDIPNLGKAGEIKTVRDGYGRNFLIPRGLAKPATRQVLGEVERTRHARLEREAEEDATLHAWQEKIQSLTLEGTLKPHEKEKGDAFGSVGAEKIAAFLKEEGIAISKSQIPLGEPLKTFGEHKIKINLGKNIVTSLRVVISPEKEKETEPRRKGRKFKAKSPEDSTSAEPQPA